NTPNARQNNSRATEPPSAKTKIPKTRLYATVPQRENEPVTAEFISASFANESNDLHPLPDAPVDARFLERCARALDDYGFNYTLIPYSSSSFDPFTLGATILAHTKNIKIIVALRPNTVYPTVAAKSLATLDQLSGGRVVVHFIAGGSDEEQAREGDFLNKEERYERQEEYIRILRLAWTSTTPFDFDGKYYQFKQFRSAVRPTNGLIPISLGGSSDAAYRIGGSLCDIFGLWGEPLAETKQQIDRIYAEAAKAGRIDRRGSGSPSARSLPRPTNWPGRRRTGFSTS
ncbi:Luciferase-like monooxygenase, partial [Rhizobium sp. RU36D]